MFRSSLIYLLANLTVASIPFVLIPILTEYLTPEEYGSVAMFQVLILGLSSLVGVNTVSAANRKYFDNRESELDIREYNTNCFYLLLFSTILILFIFKVSSYWISEVINIPEGWVIYAVYVSFLNYIITFKLGQWQVSGNVKSYAVLQVLNAVVNLTIAYIFVVLNEKGAEGRIYSIIFTSLLIAVLALIYLFFKKRIILMPPNAKYIKEAFSYGAPLFPHVFGVFLLTSLDRIVISNQLGLKEAGIYMVAVQISLGLKIFFESINKAFMPWLFNKLKSNDADSKKSIVRYTYRYFFCLLIFGGVGYILSPYIVPLVVGDSFSGSANIVGLLCLGQVFGGMYLSVTNYFFYSKDTKTLSKITVFTGFLNFTLMLAFIRYWGVTGVALSFVISRLIQFFVTWFYAKRTIELPW